MEVEQNRETSKNAEKEMKELKITFLIATARTGSTLLTRMLAAHPQVVTAVETPFAVVLHERYAKEKHWTPKIVRQYCSDFFLFSDWRVNGQFAKRDELERLLLSQGPDLSYYQVVSLTYLCFEPGKNTASVTHVLDKELKLHSRILEVAEMFPGARFIFLYRDPRDTVARRKALTKRIGKKKELTKYALGWQNVYRTIARQKKQLSQELWIDVHYEDLIRYPHVQLERICTFMQLPFDAKLAEGHLQSGSADMLGESTSMQSIHRGLTMPLMKDKIGVWKEELDSAEIRMVNAVCGEIAASAGYDLQAGHSGIRRNQPLAGQIKKKVLGLLWKNLPWIVKRWLKRITEKKRQTPSTHDD